MAQPPKQKRLPTQREVLSSSNRRLKQLRRLVAQRSERDEASAFVVEGKNLVAEALASRSTVHDVFVDESVSDDRLSQLNESATRVHLVRTGALDKVLSTVNPQPIAAVVARSEWTLDDLDPAKPVLVLDRLGDPGNVGTLCRTAEAAGFAGLVLCGNSADPTNPKAVRASAGAVLRLPIFDAAALPAERCFDELRTRGWKVLATTVEPGAVAHHAVDLSNAALVLGNEANGLTSTCVAAADGAVHIELAGPTESLNVAAAGAVLCFEALRQRRSSSMAAGSQAPAEPGRNTEANPSTSPRLDP